MAAERDVIVVGGGHNGLVAAAYLARAGLRVLVIERRLILGGACVTEEIYPGFHLSTAAYAAGLLRPKIIRDLQLKKHGLRIFVKDPAAFVPFPDGKYIFTYNDVERTTKSIARFSKRDAKNYLRYSKLWNTFFEVMDPLLLREPPTLGEVAALFEGVRGGEEALRAILTMSARDVLEDYFESEYVKVGLCGNAVIGTMVGPSTPGSAYVLGHHLLGNVDGVRGAWGYAIGGMGAVTQALAAAGAERGVDTLTGQEVRRIMVKGGRATGVELADGRRLTARVVLSNADPKRTFLRLLSPEALPEDFRRAIEGFKTDGSATKINLALDGIPTYAAQPTAGVGPHHRGTIDICPTLEYLDEAFREAQGGRWSSSPFVEIQHQSAMDPSVAPPGKHTMTLFCQYSPYRLAQGTWEEQREAWADRIIDTVAEYATDLPKLILHRQVLAPPDLEARFGLTGGNIFHGEITPDQLFSARPIPGWANYRTPVRGLYLCGSGAHPGGGVLGAPGHNAAMAVLEDLKAKIGG